ncbi:MAG: HAMP domain-containing sensor histidine kinase [Bacteroidota bacterium]
MDFYAQKTRWKWWLAIAGIVIISLSALFTIYLTNKLAENERRIAELYQIAQEELQSSPNDPELDEIMFALDERLTEDDYLPRENIIGFLSDRLYGGEDITLNLAVLKAAQSVPVLLYDYESDSINSAANFGPEKDNDPAFLRKELTKLQNSGASYLEITGYPQRLYIKKSKILTLLQYFPVVQLLLIALFIAIGYFTFSMARRGEQNRVWAGMAKETAHQLGTPISAILGWIDHVKMTNEEDEDLMEVMQELRKDVARLELIADRFSKIGSAPELKSLNIYAELEQMRAYMQRRAPRKVTFDFPNPITSPAKWVNINAHLFAWVIENLMRNALDAMGGKGEISAKIYEDGRYINLDLSDTGKGIPASKHKTVFQPGFSTKKRGWGLGLSLAKRIIEEYHDGKIFVKQSKEGEGTTFTIRLPKAETN